MLKTNTSVIIASLASVALIAGGLTYNINHHHQATENTQQIQNLNKAITSAKKHNKELAAKKAANEQALKDAQANADKNTPTEDKILQNTNSQLDNAKTQVLKYIEALKLIKTSDDIKNINNTWLSNGIQMDEVLQGDGESNKSVSPYAIFSDTPSDKVHAQISNVKDNVAHIYVTADGKDTVFEATYDLTTDKITAYNNYTSKAGDN